MRSALLWYQSQTRTDFPDGPVVKTSPSNAGDAGSISSQRAKIPHADQRNQTYGRSNIVTNSTKTLQMIHIKKSTKKEGRQGNDRKRKSQVTLVRRANPPLPTTSLSHTVENLIYLQAAQKLSYSLLLTRNLTKNSGLINAYCICYAYYILYSYNIKEAREMKMLLRKP